MSAQFLVSARKYRPLTFDTVVGQEHITTTLKNAIKTNHLAHAFLFCGPRGVGKTTCARILAKTINCEHPTPDTEACGKCANCQAFEENSGLNVFELDAASNNSVEDIRTLTEQVRFAPQIGKYKVYIIDEVHMLSANAFNAFLKTLEEPPSYAIFILATTEKHKILPTILSRCQIFDFKRIKNTDIVQHLQEICTKEAIVAEEAGLHVIAQNSEGCMRDALSMMDRISSFSNASLTYEDTIEQLNVLGADYYFQLLDALQCNDVANTILLLEKVYQKGFEGDTILNGYTAHLRDLLLCTDVAMTTLLDVPQMHKKMFFEKAKMTTTAYLISSLNILNEAEIHYKTTLNKRLHVEMTFIKLCYLNNLYKASFSQNDAKKKDDIAEISAISLPTTISEETTNNTPLATSVEEVSPVPESYQHFPPQKQEEPEVKPQEQAVKAAAVPELDLPLELPKPRISKDYLSQLQQQVATTVDQHEALPLTLELGQELFDQYVDQLKTDSEKMLQASNLAQAEIRFKEPAELVIYCNTNISQIYAQGHMEKFRKYCKQKTHNRQLKISVELAPQKAGEVPQRKSITKTELFELMVAKNPLLQKLKEGFRLEIER